MLLLKLIVSQLIFWLSYRLNLASKIIFAVNCCTFTAKNRNTQISLYFYRNIITLAAIELY